MITDVICLYFYALLYWTMGMRPCFPFCSHHSGHETVLLYVSPIFWQIHPIIIIIIFISDHIHYIYAHSSVAACTELFTNEHCLSGTHGYILNLDPSPVVKLLNIFLNFLKYFPSCQYVLFGLNIQVWISAARLR